MSALSSVMTIAGAGLYPNPPVDVGVTITANTTAVDQYTNLTVVSQSIQVTDLAISVGGNISAATLEGIITIGNSSFPGLTDVVSTGNTMANLFIGGAAIANLYLVTDAIDYNTPIILGNGDLSKFCQVFQSAQGYLSQANALLKSVKNSDIIAQTFNPETGGMNSLSTGGLNQVSSNLSALSSDLRNLGQLIDLTNLNDLGLPGELLAQLGRVTNGGIPAVSELLQAANIPNNLIDRLGRGTNELSSAQEKTVYNVLVAVTGDVLAQVFAVLNITTVGITNMAQLLNPKLLLPNSYTSLLCPANNKLLTVYLENGSINTDLEPTLANAAVGDYAGPNTTNSLETLKIIIPPDQALANKALARSLQQVKSIINTTLPQLATAMAAVQGFDNLPGLANLTTPIPSSVQDFYKAELGKGSGPNGTITLEDVIGVVGTPVINDNLNTVSNVIANLQGTGALTTLSACYVNMIDTLGNVYGNAPVVIPSGPGAGTYTDWDDAFQTGLLPAAGNEITLIVTNNSTVAQQANDAWGNIILSLTNQQINQVSAEIDFGNLQANAKSSIMSFTNALHEYGVDATPGGANQVLESLANIASLGGQSLLASLQEGRNLESLQEAGVRLDTQLPDR